MNSICIVGAGKIAYSLTKALLDAGYNVCTVVSRRKESAEQLASRFHLSCCTDKISEIPADTALFFIAVPDNEIENVAIELSKANIHYDNTIFCHLSGSQDISLLKVLKDKGASVASFHIMQTFPSYEIVNFKAHYAAVETNDPNTAQFLFSLARRLLLKPFSVSSENKTFYHLAGVFASNFLIANLFNASYAFKKSRTDEADFIDIIRPILETTISNIEKNGIAGALSGPVARGDFETIKRHVGALSPMEENMPGSNSAVNHLLLSYISNSLTLLEILEKSKNGLTERQKQIRQYLEAILPKRE